MARRRNYTTRNAYRAIERIQEKAKERSEQIAREIVEKIYVNAPRGSKERGTEHDDAGPILAESFYVKADPIGGGYIVGSRRRYWAFVEFGTRKHGDAQPYIRPSIDEVKALHS